MWKVVNEIEKNQAVSLLSLDQSRAFDCVDHGILLSKLNSVGVRGIALKWFTSYLMNRSQYVQISDKDSNLFSSNLINLNFGVPQGSILGPILFLIFVNDLPNYFEQNCCFGYADDFNIVVSTEKNVAHSMVFESWFLFNRVALNTNKSAQLKFTNYAERLKLFNMDVNLYASMKLLGIIFDNKLSWKSHNLALKKD